MEKTVFITVGTTQFDDLINCVLHDPNKDVLKVLKEKGYTQLTIQSGKPLMTAPVSGITYFKYCDSSNSV